MWILLLALANLLGCASSTESTSSNKDRNRESTVLSIQQSVNRDAALRHFIEGSLFDAKEEYASAILEYQDALHYESNPAIYYALSKDYSILGKHSLAAQAALEAVRLDSTKMVYRENLAGIYLNAFQTDLAIREYEAIIKFDSNYTQGWYNLARLYQSIRPLQALAIYERLVEREGNQWDLLMHAAELHTSLGQHLQAAEKYKRMLQLDPGNRVLQRQLAETYSRAGKFDEAVKLLQDILEVDENDPDVIAALANIYIDRKEYGRALELYGQLLKREPNNLEVKLRVASAYLAQTQRDSTLIVKAKQLFTEVNHQLPNDWRAYWYLGLIADTEKDDSLATFYVRRVTQLADWYFDAWWFIGSKQFERGEYQKALETMEQAKKNHPKEYRVYLLMGLSYSRLDQQEQAIATLEQALALNPNDVNTLSSLALSYDGIHRYQKSDSLYEQALRVDPKSHLVLNNYSYSLAERGLQLDRALKMALEAVAAEANNASYLDTLGWIYFKLGRYIEAERYIAQAVATGKASAVVHEHLGDIYFKLGKKDKAREFWQKALEMDSKNQALREKIERGSF